MRPDSRHVDEIVELGATPAGQTDARVARLGAQAGATATNLELALPQMSASTIAAALALLVLVAATGAVVLYAASSRSVLVSRSLVAFPDWLAGPLHGLIWLPRHDLRTTDYGLSAVLAAITVAYGTLLVTARSLSARVVVTCVVALHALLLLSPPLALTDLFNYLGYARLGALHNLNPYTHALGNEPHDPIYRFTTWLRWHSPYGPLFTAATYPLAWLPIAAAYWALKTMTVLASLTFLAILWRCARGLGRDPRFVLLLVGANPLYLIYGIGGFHNDFFMLALSTAAIALVLSERDRAAGAALTLAVGVKFTVVLLLPFLLLAARTHTRRLRLVVGAASAAVPMLALGVTLFGLNLPNVSGQSALVTAFSLPNLAGLAAGVGGATPHLVRLAEILVALVVIHQLWRNRDWLAGAGWSTLALLASLAWLMPWYVIWALPLAALSRSRRLRRTVLAFTVFVVATFAPATGLLLSAEKIKLPIPAPGRRELKLQGLASAGQVPGRPARAG